MLQSNGLILALLIFLGAIAALVIAGMIYGRRLAHQRHRAELAAEERAEEAGIPPLEEEDAIAAETSTEPVAKEPDPDLPVKAPEAEAAPEPPPIPKSAPAPEPAPIAETPVPVTPEPAIAPDLAGALSLTTIKGLGPKVAAMLAERGITRVDQVAALTETEASELDAQLGVFAGRMTRDRWIDQARLLASGDTAAYEAEFGKLG